MKHTKTNYRGYRVNAVENSVKFYLPRLHGYLEIIREMASEYGAMSLSYRIRRIFRVNFERVKYTRVEIHTNDINQDKTTEYTNKIRTKLH